MFENRTKTPYRLIRGCMFYNRKNYNILSIQPFKIMKDTKIAVIRLGYEGLSLPPFFSSRYESFVGYRSRLKNEAIVKNKSHRIS